MDFDAYQEKAAQTCQYHNEEDSSLIPLLGLVGEAGTLLTEYKKKIRDKDSYPVFQNQVKEELGDILWYLSAVATSQKLDLSQIAKFNLDKINDRWVASKSFTFYDEGFPKEEQLPREMKVRFVNTGERLEVYVNDENFGDALTDNAYQEDGYRFHDIMHLAFATMLGWSPTTRKLLKRKRKSHGKVDEVEDGGRAAVIDEGIVAFLFEDASDHNFYEGINTIDQTVLQSVKSLTKRFEVRTATMLDWQTCILKGFEMWRELKSNDGGMVICNLITRNMSYVPLDSILID